MELSKTAMMEAFDHLKLWIDSGLSPCNWFKNYELIHLNKEKEQIINAHGIKTSFNLNQGIEYYKTTSGEQYYNETYKQEHEIK